MKLSVVVVEAQLNFADVNECELEGVCARSDLCFNQLGDYSCIVDACPPEYRLRVDSADRSVGFCCSFCV